MFTGVMPAIITPFKNGEVDVAALKNISEWLISEGVSGLAPCGTTGEAAVLSNEERFLVVKSVCEAAKGRVPVVAGAGSNATSTAVMLTRLVREAGADAALHVTPYYNKPTQEGLFRHFEALSKEGFPVVIYNVPGRTAVNISAQTIIRCAGLPNIAGIKECGTIEQIDAVINGAPAGFALLSGEDAQNATIYKHGGRGAISVVANILPSKVSSVWKHANMGNWEAAFDVQSSLGKITKTIFIETNPIPVKTALSMMGFCAEEFRLPMTPISAENREVLSGVLKEYSLA